MMQSQHTLQHLWRLPELNFESHSTGPGLVPSELIMDESAIDLALLF
jgi:hypothetical protein